MTPTKWPGPPLAINVSSTQLEKSASPVGLLGGIESTKHHFQDVFNIIHLLALLPSHRGEVQRRTTNVLTQGLTLSVAACGKVQKVI